MQCARYAYWSWSASSLLLLLVLAWSGQLLAQMRAAEDVHEDPFASDPFGGPNVRKSLSGWKVLSRAIEGARRRAEAVRSQRLYQLRHELKGLYVSGTPLPNADDKDDVHVFEILLTRLHSAHGDPAGDRYAVLGSTGIDYLESLVKRKWYRLPDEKPSALFERLKNSPTQDGRHIDRELARVVREYNRLVEVHDRMAVAAWREKESLWLGLLGTIAEANLAEDPAAVFRRQLPNNPHEAFWYRAAYLRVMRYTGRGEFDAELAKPLLDVKSTREEIVRLCDVLNSLAALSLTRSDPATRDSHPAYPELHQRLQALLPQHNDDLTLAQSLAGHCRANPSHLKELDAWLQTEASPAVVEMIARDGGADAESVARWMLGRPIKIELENASLQSALDQMQRLSRFPLCLDRPVRESQARVTLTAEGAWLEVLDQILAGAGFESARIGSKYLWIGQPEDRRAAANLLASAASVPGKVGRILLDETQIEFIETPLRDVVEYLKDAHELEMQLLEQSDFPITRNLRSLPLILVLADIAQEAKFDWYATEEMIVIGPAAKVAAFRQAMDRQSKRKIRGDRLAKVLVSSANLEFIETPLQDTLSHLHDLHEIEFTALSAQDRAITSNQKNVTLDTALSTLAVVHGLDWDRDEKQVVIGLADHIAAWRMCQRRQATRQRAIPAEAQEKLKEKLVLQFKEKPLREVIESLSETTTLPIKVSTIFDIDRRVTLDDADLTLEMHLDLLTVRHGVSWRFQEGEIILDDDRAKMR